jgi:tetrahydromethanopterin S-methyltransferase subunit G
MSEDSSIPMRTISMESVEDDIEEKMHEIKKTIGETIGEKLGIFELNTVGVMLTEKSSLKAVRVAFSLAVFHHINLVIFSRAGKILEGSVTNDATDLGIEYSIKHTGEVTGVDILIVSSKKEVPKNIEVPLLQVI